MCTTDHQNLNEQPPSLLIRRHQTIIFHPNRKIQLAQMRSMRPRLQPILPPNRARKTRTPPPPRKRAHHTLNSPPMHQQRIASHIIENRSELYQRPYPRKRARLAQVLVSDDGLRDALGLCGGRGEGLQQGEGEETAVEFEG